MSPQMGKIACHTYNTKQHRAHRSKQNAIAQYHFPLYFHGSQGKHIMNMRISDVVLFMCAIWN